ncbi:MAG TPA: hypothetical protein VNJ28_04720 [Candidatus Limnocylindrales bacterium]|nr:hypothetical protein [Candidatus Limnocylindrales bacterium]
MDQTIALALVAAATVGLVATLAIVRRQRKEAEAMTAESPFAASTEGMKLCPKCGQGNLWTDRECIACGEHLKG